MSRREGPATWPPAPARRRQQPVELLGAEGARIRVERKNGEVHWIEVDIEDLAAVSQYTWWLDCGGGGRTRYAATTHSERGKSRHYLLHRLLLQAPEGDAIDHRDGNGLNNRRSNLRIATQQQNRANELVLRQGTSSRYKGVTWTAYGGGGWTAQARQAGTFTNLGTFDREVDAALAYDDAMRVEFGEFAATNFSAEYAAAAERWPRRRRRRGTSHGTAGYARGCRCATCVDTYRAAERIRYQRRKAART